MPGAIPFGTEFLVNTTTKDDQVGPTITGLADGRFVVAWTDRSSGDVRAQIFNADGSKSGGEFLVNTTTTGFQGDPTITALADGRFVVAWQDNSQSGGDTSGIAAVRAQVFNADGSKSGAEFLVNTTTTGFQGDPTITALAGGRFVVAWTDASQSGGDTSEEAVRAQVFNADGSKSGVEFLVNTTTTYWQIDPTIAALADGRFVVAWTDAIGDTSGDAVQAQVFNADGSKSGAQFLVNTATNGVQDEPSITAMADGRFVVAWEDQSQSDDGVRAQIFNADGSKSGADFLVNTTTMNAGNDPSITALADGRFVVAWDDFSQSSGDTSDFAVRAQVFNADGSKSGGEFLVNTTTANSQAGSTITVLADGRFVVAWGDNSQRGGDRSGGAVRGQIFDPREEALILSGTALGDDFVGTRFGDLIDGRSGNDRIDGAGGGDTLRGGGGSDTLSGGGDHDYLDGGTGDDILQGGAGGDSYYVDSTNDQVIEQADGGTDYVSSSVSFTLGPNIENLVLTGTANINGTGNALANTLTGNAGINQLRGLAGNDTYVLANGTDAVIDVSGIDTIISTITRSLAAYSAIENLTLDGTAAINGTGNALTNTLTGNAGINQLRGLAGNDTLRGGGDHDYLNGGTGDDILQGGAGGDSYYVDSTNDQVIDHAGPDIEFVVSSANFTLPDNIEHMYLTGNGNINGTGNDLRNTIRDNAGINLLTGRGGDDSYVVQNTGDQVIEQADGGTDYVSSSVSFTLGPNIENLVLTGTANINGTGNALANTLTGNAGINQLRGLAGNDTYVLANGTDTVIDVSGIDTIISTITRSLAAYSAIENLTLDGTAAINGTGNAIANIIRGNGAANVLNGRAGGDTISGLGGNDSYVVDSAGDKIVETAGNGTDNVNASVSYALGNGVSVETLRTTNAAGTAAINLTGNEIGNIVTGNAGANIINGGAGNDILTGNAGNDIFVFNTPLNAATNVDTIKDFVVADDSFRLENSGIFNGLAAGVLNADAFHIGPAAADAEDRVIYNSATGELFFDSNGNAAGGSTLFAKLSTGLTLSHTDFNVV